MYFEVDKMLVPDRISLMVTSAGKPTTNPTYSNIIGQGNPSPWYVTVNGINSGFFL
jgi:hypothetical protein